MARRGERLVVPASITEVATGEPHYTRGPGFIQGRLGGESTAFILVAGATSANRAREVRCEIVRGGLNPGQVRIGLLGYWRVTSDKPGERFSVHNQAVDISSRRGVYVAEGALNV